MSTGRKHKTSFKKKKKSTRDYWGDDLNEPQYTEEQKKRIASYLKENDENCKESTTLILIIVIGLLVALSIVGFLAIRNNSSVKYKGAHTTYEHTSNNSILNMVWGKWTWLQNELLGVTTNMSVNATRDAKMLEDVVELQRELDDFQPIYRNPLLQQLYTPSPEDEDDCQVSTDDSIFQFLTIKHGSWRPSQKYLQEAVDFSWADFETEEEIEEEELVQTEDANDMTEKDKKEHNKMKEKILKERKKRQEERKKRQDKKKKEKQSSRRRLLGKNTLKFPGGKGPGPIPPGLGGKGPGPKNFDPFHAFHNPANIIKALNPGDEGAGDIEQRIVEKSPNSKNFPKIMPGFLKNRDLSNPQSIAKAIRDHLPFGNKHLNHLDEIMRHNKDKGIRQDPNKILDQLDLTKFGIDKITKSTSNEVKKEDLEKLEEKEAKLHPYMTLLTNPGQMDDVKCIKNDYRKHELQFKVMDKSDANDQINNGGMTDKDGKKSIFSYDNDVLRWYCYLVQIRDIDDLEEAMDGAFRVNLTLYDVDLEIGFDVVEVYINSQLIDTISGIGRNWINDEDYRYVRGTETQPEFIYWIDKQYLETYGTSLEVCMKIKTDSNIIKGGFNSRFSVDYDDPKITKWSDWGECTTAKVGSYKGAKNSKHWNGDCGIGIHSKSVTCVDPETVGDDGDVTADQRALCIDGEKRTEYCVKANCYDFPLNEAISADNPVNAFKFNGHGRVDPDYPDPYIIQRSTQESFNLSNTIFELSLVRDEIVQRYPTEHVLGSAVINHYHMDDSRLRLGIRLARSLLLGDTFTVYTTGSSNTAGHENMFMSTYSMQFQSIMRPIWRRLGYKGAAFIVKNHAEGGAVSSMHLSWCIPQLIGDDADVVFWESQMNDHGDAIEHAVENHFRNAITKPRRPLYHVMHAGKNGGNKDGFAGKYDDKLSDADKNKGKDGGYKNEDVCYSFLCGKDKGKNPDYPGGLLLEPYVDYGSGITLFFPTYGTAPINKTKYQEFKTEYLYISWHPGPPGHRVYAEILAYHYLTSVIQVLMDIKDLIEELTPEDAQGPNKPIAEMLEILEDPPTKPLPDHFSAGQCDPLCTNSTESVCLSGYRTLGKPEYALKRFREKHDKDEDIGKWQYDSWMKDPEAFYLMKGGLGFSDIKDRWFTKDKDSVKLKFIFEAKQYGFISIEVGDRKAQVPKVNGKNPKVEIIINEVDTETGEINNELESSKDHPFTKKLGKPLKCEDKPDKKYWGIFDMFCTISGLQPYHKYEITFNTLDSTNWEVRNIRVF